MEVWRRYAGVRVRSTLAAATIVAIALLVAGLGGWWLARRTLANEARDTVTLRSQDLAASVQQQGAADLETERRPAFGEVIQVLDTSGRVITAAPPSATSLQLAARLGLSADRPLATGQVTVEVPALPQSGADEPYVLVARRVRDGVTHQDVVLVVGRSVAGLAETVGEVGKLGVVGLPALVLVTGAVTYVFTGRALAPVEEMRRRVQNITSRRLEDRVPVPDVHDEIGRLAETMNGMLASLQSAQEAQRRFVADAGHELRSPLATITTTLEVARAGTEPGSPAAQVFEDLTGETMRMSRLVDDLLTLARADERGLRLRTTDVDLDDLVETEVRRLRLGEAGSSPSLDIGVRTEPVRVTGDPDRLAQVLRNLTDNARRHARSRIRLDLCREASAAVLRVDDDGPGVPEAERTRVFERFVRLDAARDRGSGGSGLGLAIVREIVTGHGGRVRLQLSPLGGARVEVTLPASPVTDHLLPAPLVTDRPLPASPAPGQPPSGSSR